MALKTLTRAGVAAALLLAALPALAHPGHGGGGFGAGLLHPLTGIDHLLGMVAAGMWSGRQPGSGRALPAAFLAMLAAGAIAGMAGLRLPALEGGIALTVALTGVLVAAAVRLPVRAGMLVLGAFAVWHGNAHGIELPQWTSAAGLLLTSAGLLLAGRRLAALPQARWVGGAVALAGITLLAL